MERARIAVAKPVVRFVVGMKEMPRLLLVTYGTQLPAQRKGGNVAGPNALDLFLYQLLLGREEAKFGAARDRRLRSA